MNFQLDNYDKKILQSLKKRGGQLSANDFKKAVVADEVCKAKTFWHRIDKLVKSGFLIKKASSEHKQKILYTLRDVDIQEKKQVKNFLDSFNGLRDHIEILKNKSWKHSIIKRGGTLNDSLPNYQHLRELVKEQCPKCDFKSVIFIREHKKTFQLTNSLKDTQLFSDKEIIMISSKDNRAIEHHNEKRMQRYLIGRLMTQQLILEGLYKKMSERNRYSKDFVDVEPYFHKIEEDLTDLGKKYELDLSKIQESLLESTMKISVSLQKTTSKSFQDFDIRLGEAEPYLNGFGLDDYREDSSLL